MPRIAAVLAGTATGGIGIRGDLPWRIGRDMAFFRRITCETTNPTLRNAVVMGRKTWDSIPARFRPLVSRLNVVITRNPTRDGLEIAETAANLDDAIEKATKGKDVETVFIVGGAGIYKEALERNLCDVVYWTAVKGEFECDVFVMPLQESEWHKHPLSEELTQGGIQFQFFRYTRKSAPATPSLALADVAGHVLSQPADEAMGSITKQLCDCHSNWGLVSLQRAQIAVLRGLYCGFGGDLESAHAALRDALAVYKILLDEEDTRLQAVECTRAPDATNRPLVLRSQTINTELAQLLALVVLISTPQSLQLSDCKFQNHIDCQLVEKACLKTGIQFMQSAAL
eukprot:m.64231 g.64231  ORF g.64231 m.64231 type:complete len:342 (-) comp7504_c0_seq3:139-1164(-)